MYYDTVGVPTIAYGFNLQTAINAAVAATDDATKRAQYNRAADQMKDSAWYTQVGNRAKRNVAMMRSSAWVNPNGDGSS